jgi:hypothetical protein
MNEEWRLVTSSKAYQDYVVFVDTKGSRGRSTAEHLCQVCTPSGALAQAVASAPDRLIDFRPAVYSAIFTVSNVSDS